MADGNKPVRRKPPRDGVFTREPIPDDFSGIEIEIGRMIDNVREFSGEPSIVRFARKVVSNCKDRDHICEAKAIFNFLQRNTRFINDPHTKEFLVTPKRLFEDLLDFLEAKQQGRKAPKPVEDCDGLATFTATFLGAVGIEPVFVFGGFRDQGFFHVWAGAIINDKIKNLDISVKSLKFNQVHSFNMFDVVEIF